MQGEIEGRRASGNRLDIFESRAERGMNEMVLSPTQPEEFLTPQEVADRLKVSIFTVRRWIVQNTLPAYKVGRGWRISRADFEYWLKINRHAV